MLWPRGGQQAGAAQANRSFGLITGEGDPREQGSGAGQSSTQESAAPQASRGMVGVGDEGTQWPQSPTCTTWTCGSGSANPEGGVDLVSILKDRSGLAGEGAQKTKRRW